jgi:hypothetical protein
MISCGRKKASSSAAVLTASRIGKWQSFGKMLADYCDAKQLDSSCLLNNQFCSVSIAFWLQRGCLPITSKFMLELLHLLAIQPTPNIKYP